MYRLFQIKYHKRNGRIFVLRDGHWTYSYYTYNKKEAEYIIDTVNSPLHFSLPEDKSILKNTLWFHEEEKLSRKKS